MFEKMKEKIRYSLQEETTAERSARMLPGALYGAFAATVYILILFTLNAITIPGLHLAIDWTHLLTYWIGFGLGLALAGAIVGWFTEDYAGVVSGAIIMTVLLLVGNLVISLISGGNASSLFQSVVTAVPLIGGAVLIAGGLRYVIKRHLQNIQTKEPRQRRKLVASLIGIIFLVSFVPGFLARYDSSAIKVFRALNIALQKGSTDPLLAARFSATQLPGLKDHFGKDFKVYPHVSVLFAGSLDITVRFKDGYVFSCVVPTDAGEETFFTTCNEGEKFNMP
jgi:uncharacterized membrane protein